MEQVRNIVKDIVKLAFAILVFAIAVKFFFYPDIKVPEKSYQHQFDSLGLNIKLLEQKNEYLEGEMKATYEKIKEIDSLRNSNDKQLTNELKKLKGVSNRRVISVADSIYNSANR